MALSARHFRYDDALRANEDPGARGNDDLKPDLGYFPPEDKTLRCTCGLWEWDPVLLRWVWRRFRISQLSVTCLQCHDYMGVVIDHDRDGCVMTTTPILQRRNQGLPTSPRTT